MNTVLAQAEYTGRWTRSQAPPAAAPLGVLYSTCFGMDPCPPDSGPPDSATRCDCHQLDCLVFTRRVKKGCALYHQGDSFEFIHGVRSGTFKSALDLRDGREHVTGFQMAGEMLGLDALATGRHASSAVALENAETWAIPYSRLSDPDAASPALHHAISRVMSQEIVRDHRIMLLLGTMGAEERLAVFLLNISRRLKARGYSPREFHLRMSRADIGSYLGMKVETVSRTFSTFQQEGLLSVAKKHVSMLDLDGLRRKLASDGAH